MQTFGIEQPIYRVTNIQFCGPTDNDLFVITTEREGLLAIKRYDSVLQRWNPLRESSGIEIFYTDFTSAYKAMTRSIQDVYQNEN